MKFAVLIPTRNNRPELLKNCLRMISNQTVHPSHIEIVDDAPISEKCDITWRYRIGYDRLRNKGFDVIFFIEDDDNYHPTYFELMLNKWQQFGKPELFGTNYTIYYHIRLFAWFTYHHHDRSSAMSSMIKPDMNFAWPVDHEPFTDMWLWQKLKGVTFTPDSHICIGIKHGTTITGGRSHIDRLHRYINKDEDKSFLKSVCDEQSFNFYSNFIK